MGKGKEGKEMRGRMKKIVSCLLAVALAAMVCVPTLALTAFAEGTGSITISNATEGNTYTAYKIFDASYTGSEEDENLVVSYTIPNDSNIDNSNVEVTLNESSYGFNDVFQTTALSGKTGVEQKSGVSEEVVLAWLKAYISGLSSASESGSVIASGDTLESGGSVTISNLEYGYYYVTTTTGTAVSITSVNPNATVEDKNEAPELDKKITGVTDGSCDNDGKKALAQVGTTVTYTATINVKNGAVGYVFHDQMSAGLSYNNDVKVSVDNTIITESNTTYSKTTTDDDTIIITFVDSWIKAQVDKTITITYSATVTSGALSTNPATNTATLDYGDSNSVESSTEVYNAKFTVTKVDGSNNPLAGASFVLKNTSGRYYKLTGGVVSWVEDKEEATVHTTTSVGNGHIFAFEGLANGTYTLVETSAPSGYNVAADYEFTISGGDYSASNLEQSTTITNRSGHELPSTGGMGTTVLYVIGGVLVVCAGVGLVARRRVRSGR